MRKNGATKTTEPTPSDEGRDYHGHHVTWCTNHDGEFLPAHSPDEPYCSKLIHGVDLIAEAPVVSSRVWVMPTHAFAHGYYTPAECAELERRYNGIELTIESSEGLGKGWSESKLRLTSDCARSLAASLIRAADIEQGLTR